MIKKSILIAGLLVASALTQAQEEFYGSWIMENIESNNFETSEKDRFLLGLIFSEAAKEEKYKYILTENSLTFIQPSDTVSFEIKWVSDTSYVSRADDSVEAKSYFKLISETEMILYGRDSPDITHFRRPKGYKQ
jgi:hypothetical protein